MLSLMVAAGRDNAIGRDGGMPWHLPGDLAHFKQVTMGKPIVMGRRTHEAIGRALPGRRNLVVTRNRNYAAPGCEVVHSLDEALARTADAAEVVVIGGEQLYREALPRATRIYLTRIEAEFPGADTFFPALDRNDWREVAREARPADERNAYACRYLVLERKR